jgi:ubiquinone/menaquinone biosynthesis C-methylase UbiE
MSDQANVQEDTTKAVVERYSQRDNPGFEAVMALRTAAKEGAFFLQHLRTGMRVLDVGCGPGSITLGFADAVAPGEVVGVDFQPSQVAQAQTLTAARGVMNVRFEVADAYRLPFPDESFDAVFAHAVLWHLREPVKALQEMRRVLRPGGVVGIRECDWGGRIHAPITPILEQWYTLTVKIRRHNGGDPFLGRECRRLMLEAGFMSAEASVSAWSAGTPEELQRCSNFLKAQLKGFAPTALAEGWIDLPTIEKVALEIEAWAGRPDALYVDTYCEVLGRLDS